LSDDRWFGGLTVVQPTLTDNQALALAQACDFVVFEAELRKNMLEESEVDEFKRLSVFLYDVAANPQKYPSRAAAQIRKRLSALKGPAQPAPRNKRKQRQETRMATAKRRRAERAKSAAEWNAQVAEYEAAMAQAAAE